MWYYRGGQSINIALLKLLFFKNSIKYKRVRSLGKQNTGRRCATVQVQQRKRVERFCAIYNTAIETVLYNIDLVYIRNVNDLVWNIAVIDQNCFLVLSFSSVTTPPTRAFIQG
jgi:hypothetical protein